MRLLVISDSHGSKWNLFDAIEKEPTAEVIYFLGDGYRDLEEAREKYPDKRFIAVRGNCDLACDYPERDIRSFGNVKIYATHGYMEKVKYGLYILECAANEENCSLAIFGHTHQSHTSYYEGLHMFNPGSIRDGLYGIVDVTDTGVICINKSLGY